MNRISSAAVIQCLYIAGAVLLTGCQGVLSEIYDEPKTPSRATVSGQLYVDASDWGKWHYIDLDALSDSVVVKPDFNTSSLWITYSIPLPDGEASESTPTMEQTGIYTYWYDIFGAGISKHEYRGFIATGKQAEPENWTIAVHRNNVRTNGAEVCETNYSSLEQLPSTDSWLETLEFEPDSWNETEVWAVQDRMLAGLIGNQGIYINNVLGRWLTMEIPPMPPTFKHNNHVFILRLSDGKYAALQLTDYISPTGTKCGLTINYKYPI